MAQDRDSKKDENDVGEKIARHIDFSLGLGLVPDRDEPKRVGNDELGGYGESFGNTTTTADTSADERRIEDERKGE